MFRGHFIGLNLSGSRFAAVLLWTVIVAAPSSPAGTAPPKWITVSSAHFAVVSDAEEKKGREVALRFEQMRAVFAQLLLKSRLNIPQPLEIFALANGQEYAQTAPLRGPGSSEPGFFLANGDRNFIVLNLAVNESWHAIAHDFAQWLLDYNYPPTQNWFDAGFTGYFASIRLGNKQVQLGELPEAVAGLLNTSTWFPLPELFTAKGAAAGATHPTLFDAESWMVVHYLLNQNKLPETGTYFGLVQNVNVPVAQAIQQAYGMSPAQLEQTVKDYFHSLASPTRSPGTAQSSSPGPQVLQLPSPVEAETFPASITPVPPAEADAMLAEIRAHIPERRLQAVQELRGMASQPGTDSAIAHRALAWDHLEKKEYAEALDELSSATEIDRDDHWTRYYLALVKYRASGNGTQSIQGLGNMMQDLRAVLDWYPEFAEAYSMLAMARLQGGGVASATEAMRAALLLSPRNQSYVLNMARIYLAGKKWEAATTLLERLKAGSDPQIAAAAKRNLDDLPSLKKYGIAPQHPEDSATAQASQPLPKPQRPAKPPVAAEDDEERRPEEPAPDKRPIKFLKGKLVSVDCSRAPVAVLTFVARATTLHLRAADYKTLLLIGADEFSCDWQNRAAIVNYKAGGTADGDLVSLELQ
jgi:Flp pilus assembly protein TadD